MDAVHYQRAVTPTISSIDATGSISGAANAAALGSNVVASGVGIGSGIASGAGGASSVRGKALTYQSHSQKEASGRPKIVTGSTATIAFPSNVMAGTSSPVASNRFAVAGRNVQPTTNAGDITIQGKAHSSGSSVGGSSKGLKSTVAADGSVVIDPNLVASSSSSLNGLVRQDLVPLSDEIPADGIIFARYRNQPDSLVVFRTPEERLRNPERLNLDRRQLEVCPVLEQEHRLRLLNFQNNNIRSIQNLENLSNLIFLDLYNNKLQSLEGPLSAVKGLRVLMAGKNKISMVSNLTNLRKLDVLDLHSNEIRLIEGLAKLTDLRVLNLAGNRINVVQNLSTLHALTELNLRRNKIEKVFELDRLPALQRVFLSHNLIANVRDMGCLFNVKLLIELSLDGNPISEHDNNAYRVRVIAGMPSLRHLDLKRITDEERASAVVAFSALEETEIGLLDSKDNPSAEDASNAQLTRISSAKPPVSAASARSLLALATDGLNGDINNVSSPVQGGLAQLARAGKLSPSQPMFDLEIIGPNEKALIAVGDTWEWVQAKRLLSTVVEASLLHVKKEIVVARFVSNIASLPALRAFRLMYNDIDSIHDLLTIFDSLGPTTRMNMESFAIMHNPVCVNFYNLMKSYALLSFPKLKLFNDDAVSFSDVSKASATLTPLLNALSIGAASPAAGYLISQQLQQQQPPTNSSSPLAVPSSTSTTSGGSKTAMGQRRRDTMTLVSNASSIAYRRVSVSSADLQGLQSAASNLGANSLFSVADMSATVISRREVMRLFDAAMDVCTKEIIQDTISQYLASRNQK